jgi:hypothetical protein
VPKGCYAHKTLEYTENVHTKEWYAVASVSKILNYLHFRDAYKVTFFGTQQLSELTLLLETSVYAEETQFAIWVFRNFKSVVKAVCISSVINTALNI